MGGEKEVRSWRGCEVLELTHLSDGAKDLGGQQGEDGSLEEHCEGADTDERRRDGDEEGG